MHELWSHLATLHWKWPSKTHQHTNWISLINNRQFIYSLFAVFPAENCSQFPSSSFQAANFSFAIPEILVFPVEVPDSMALPLKSSSGISSSWLQFCAHLKLVKMRVLFFTFMQLILHYVNVLIRWWLSVYPHLACRCALILFCLKHIAQDLFRPVENALYFSRSLQSPIICANSFLLTTCFGNCVPWDNFFLLKCLLFSMPKGAPDVDFRQERYEQIVDFSELLTFLCVLKL